MNYITWLYNKHKESLKVIVDLLIIAGVIILFMLSLVGLFFLMQWINSLPKEIPLESAISIIIIEFGCFGIILYFIFRKSYRRYKKETTKNY